MRQNFWYVARNCVDGAKTYIAALKGGCLVRVVIRLEHQTPSQTMTFVPGATLEDFGLSAASVPEY